MIRRTRFIPPRRPQSRPAKSVRHIVEPTRGFNNSSVNLQITETPYSLNWIGREGYITPRSGLSRLDQSVTTRDFKGGVVDFLTAHPSIDGTEIAYAISGKTILQHAPAVSTSSWSLVPIGTTFITSAKTKVPDTFFEGFWDSTQALNQAEDGYVTVLTNPNEVTFQISAVSGSPGTPSFLSSLLSSSATSSYHRFVEVIDNRLVFFSEKDLDGIYPYRVRWSVRGSHQSFQQVGAGFEDIKSMSGIPSGFITHVDRGFLFTTDDVWIAQPRRDAYAFDFDKLQSESGCVNPATLAMTPIGPIWLGKGNTFYTVQGSAVVPFGWEIREFLSINLREPRLSWAVYDEGADLYRFHYSNTTGQYPTEFVALDIKSLRQSQTRPGELDGAWWPGNYPYQLSSGAFLHETNDHGADRNMLVGSSAGSIFHELSNQTTDNGSVITARYRTPVMEPTNPEAFGQLNEAWVEAMSTSTATTGLRTTMDYGLTFQTHSPFVTSNESHEVGVAVNASASQHPQVEILVNDGSLPKIARLRLFFREFTGRRQ